MYFGCVVLRLSTSTKSFTLMSTRFKYAARNSRKINVVTDKKNYMEIQGVQSDHIMLGHVDNAAIYF